MIKDRNEGGKLLAEKLVNLVKGKNVIVLAIPRGGVIVGYEIAKILDCVLDVVISKKITPIDHPEYAIGAITYDGTLYCGSNWKRFSNEPNFEDEIQKKKIEVKRRLEEYRGNDNYKFENKTVILVDDGIATGSTIFVLLKWLSQRNVSRIILATPVIPASTYEEMKSLVNEIVALEIPTGFSSVGQFYKKFVEVSDNEVMALLEEFKSKSNFVK